MIGVNAFLLNDGALEIGRDLVEMDALPPKVMILQAVKDDLIFSQTLYFNTSQASFTIPPFTTKTISQ